MAKILHIEDNPENLILVRRLLEAEGHTVVEAHDGIAGIRLAETGRPDLILMDINLPGLDGNEATTMIKRTRGLASVPIVAVTSNVFPGAKERCLVAGCDGYIPKPIDVDMFVPLLEAYLRGQRDDLPLEQRAHYLDEYSRDLAQSLQEHAYARQFLQDIIMQSPVSTLITDTHGVCVMHNEVCDRVFNLPKGQSLVGRYRLFDDPQIRTAGHSDEIRSVFREAGHAQFQIKYEISGRGERIIRFSVFPVQDSSGQLRNVVVQHIDVTEEIRAVEEQERLRNQLFQAQKMESIGTLAGGVAHDYNNLLVGVLGGAELLLKNMDPQDHNYKLLCIIRDSALKMSDLTKSLLAYAQGGKFLPEHVEINEFIRETVNFSRRLMDRQIDVTLDLEEGLPPVTADRGQLHQTLINIIMNAAESIRGKGAIRVETRLAENPRDTSEEGENEGPYVMVRVSDTGCGMTPDVLERIFEPFFSTKGTGRGLGLSAIYGIAKQHRASIRAKSRPGEGTQIELRWPARRAQEAWGEELGKMNAASRVEEDAVPRGIVLVVDDEEIVREVATDILNSGGYEVMSVDDGDRAVDVIKNNPGVQVVILDIIMKRMNGKETFQAIKKIRPELRVLLSSGYDQQGPVGEIMGMGADGFIQKPYNLEELVGSVRNLMSLANGGT